MFSLNQEPQTDPTLPINSYIHFPFSSYLVTNLMGADLNNIVKFQRLSDEHVQFLIYQLLRGLKVILYKYSRTPLVLYYVMPTTKLHTVPHSEHCVGLHLQYYIFILKQSLMPCFRPPSTLFPAPKQRPWFQSKNNELHITKCYSICYLC